MTYIPDDFEGVEIEELESLLDYECSEVDMSMLISAVSIEEVKKVLFSMAADKSPGPDGYTTEFFKTTWHITGKDLVTAVQSFLIRASFPRVSTPPFWP